MPNKKQPQESRVMQVGNSVVSIDGQSQSAPEEEQYTKLSNAYGLYVLYDLMRAMAVGKIDEYVGRKTEISKGETITIEPINNGAGRRITQQKGKRKFIIEIGDISKFAIKTDNLRKTFMYTLSKLPRVISRRGLTRDYIAYPAQELVDADIYSDIQKAINGFAHMVDALSDIKMKWEIPRRGKKKIQDNDADDLQGFGLSVPFYHAKGGHDNGQQLLMMLDASFDWPALLEFFTIIPKKAFSAPTTTFDFLVLIFHQARQKNNYKLIQTQGYFDIRNDHIKHWLFLPALSKTKNPRRDCIDPLKTSEKWIRENIDDMGIDIPFKDENGVPLVDFFDNGITRISFTGDLKERFVELSMKRQEKQKELEANKRRRRPRQGASKQLPAASTDGTETANAQADGTDTTDE